MRRALALWLLLFGAYAATLGLRDDGAARYTAAEAHRLLVADSIVHDADINVANQYRARAWSDWHVRDLRPAGRVVAGRRVEPAGIGTPLLIAPAYALGGPVAVELWCAALLALAFVLAAAIARRIVPDPWATRAALLCGLSPPALAASTTIAPEPGAALALTAAALLALRVREQPRLSWAAACAVLIAPLPWLSVRAIPLGGVVAVSLFRWLHRRQRALAGFVALEVVLVSGVVYFSLHERLFGGLTAASARAHGPAIPGPQPAELGEWLLRAPLLVLAGAGVWLLWRSRRDHLAVVVGEQVDVETSATLCALLAGVALAWPREATLVLALPATAGLVAWGLRFAPRAGALLAAVTLGESAWLLLRL